jgi:arylsulfatase A-like enzyme
MLEPAAHVPMLARWPGRFKAGVRCDAPVSLIDVFPTFMQAAGADDIRPSAEAESLLDVAAAQTDRQYVFSQIGAGKHGHYLITDGRWKYIYSAADEKEWLFDLHTDPHETHSLAYNAMFMPKVEELRAILIDKLAGTGYAVADGEWRKYEKAEMPGDSDHGLLFQDPPDLQGRIDALGEGYARDVTVRPEDAGVLLRMMHEID